MIRIKKIAIFFIVMLFITTGCQGVNSGLKKGSYKKLLPVKVDLVDMESIYLSNKDCKEPIVIDMLFSIFNPNPVPVTVIALEWTVSVEGTRLGALAVQEEQYIPANEEIQVRKTYFLNAKMGAVNLLLAGVVVNLKDGAARFGEICTVIKNEKAVWVMDGTAYVDGETKTMSVPFSVKWN